MVPTLLRQFRRLLHIKKIITNAPRLSKQICKLSFQMSARVYSIPDQTEGRREAFLEWTSIHLSSKQFFTCGGNVIIKCSSSYSYSACGNTEHPGKSVKINQKISKLSFQLSVQVCSLLGRSKREWKAFFKGC